MRCLITGAAGFVGSHLAEELIAQGNQVRCLVRQTSNLVWLKSLPVELARGDVLTPESLRSAVDGVEKVYHVAGLTRAFAEDDYVRVNAGGTGNLLEACLASGGRLNRVVVVSSLSAAGPGAPGRAICEDDPPRPLSRYGRSKLQAERVAATFSDRLPISVVRPAAVYGPRDRDTLLLFELANWGLCPITWRQRVFSLIDVRDLARGLIAAGEGPCRAGRIYNLANPKSETLDRVTHMIARSVGRRALTVRLPAAAFYASGAVRELAARARGRPGIFDREKARELAQPNWVCDTSRARDELAFEARVPTEQGICDAARWYRAAGWL